MKPSTIGILLIVGSQIAFALMDSTIKVLGNEISLASILLFRNLITLVFVAPLFLKSGSLHASFGRIHLHFMRSISGVLGMIFIFLSIKFLPLSDATVLRSISPLFIPVLAFIWLKEKLSLMLIPCFTIAIIGTLFLSGLDKPELTWLSLLPILSGVFTAFAMVSIKRMSNIASGAEIVFYFSLIGTGVSLVFGIFGALSMPSNLYVWSIVAFMGILGTIGQITMTRANQYISASVLAPFYYLNPVFGALISHFFWGEKLGSYGWIGAALVIFAGILLTTQRK